MGAVETLVAERIDIAKLLREKADQAIAENGGVFTDAQIEEVDGLRAKFVEKTKDIDRARSLTATRDEVAEFLGKSDAEAVNETALSGSTLGVQFPRQRKSIGDTFLGSANYKGLMKNYPQGQIPETTRGINSGPVQIPGLKALLTGADHTTSAGILVPPQQIANVAYPVTPLGLRNLITVGTTGSDKIEYAQVLPAGVGGSVSNAAGIREATSDAVPAPAPPAGGVKPQSEMKFRKKSLDVITIAHWVAATKRALSDAGQLRTLIDAFLTDGIARKVEELIVNGDKDTPTAPDTEEWDGILNTSGVQDVPFDTNLFATARHMITHVQGAGGNLTAFAANPLVAESIDLAMDSSERYYGAGPFGTGPTTLWGRPLVTVYDIPDDVIIGGDWSTCVLWDRESTTITATDAHEDFFTRNLVAILAEARAAFGILNPQLMCIGHTVVAGP